MLIGSTWLAKDLNLFVQLLSFPLVPFQAKKDILHCPTLSLVEKKEREGDKVTGCYPFFPGNIYQSASWKKQIMGPSQSEEASWRISHNDMV